MHTPADTATAAFHPRGAPGASMPAAGPRRMLDPARRPAAGARVTRSGAQEGEHGQHAAVIVPRRGQVQLREDARHVLLNRALADHELLGDGVVRAALCHQPEHLALSFAELLERILAAVAPEQLAD